MAAMSRKDGEIVIFAERYQAQVLSSDFPEPPPISATLLNIGVFPP
jgi:hypothetical protein